MSHIAYLYICTLFLLLFFIILLLLFLLSVSCPVAVILLHCGASVTIPRMCKHTWPIKLILTLHTHAHTHARTHARTHTHTHTHTHVGFYGLRGLSIGVMVFILYKLYVLLPYTYPTPKLSPHRRRCISTFPPKNLLCMIYKHFELWGH